MAGFALQEQPPEPLGTSVIAFASGECRERVQFEGVFRQRALGRKQLLRLTQFALARETQRLAQAQRGRNRFSSYFSHDFQVTRPEPYPRRACSTTFFGNKSWS